MTERTDEQLLADFAETGEQRHFERLYERYSTELTEYVVRRFYPKDESAADDVVQQTFLKVHLNHEQFNPLMKFRPWLFSLAANNAINMQVERGRKPTVALSRRAGQIGEATDYDPEDHRPAMDAERIEEIDGVRKACERLPADERAAVQAVFFEGQTHQQAAEALKIPLGSLKTRMHRAFGRLRGEFGGLRVAS